MSSSVSVLESWQHSHHLRTLKGKPLIISPSPSPPTPPPTHRYFGDLMDLFTPEDTPNSPAPITSPDLLSSIDEHTKDDVFDGGITVHVIYCHVVSYTVMMSCDVI